VVYFKIREGDNSKIKIGYTADRRGGTKRRKELQTGSPELLIDYIEPLWGHTKQTEKYFHAFLKRQHIRGDWFYLNKESKRIVRQIIDEIKRADMSMPLFAYAQRHDTQIFQLEQQLGAIKCELQKWRENAIKLGKMFIEVKADNARLNEELNSALDHWRLTMEKLLIEWKVPDPDRAITELADKCEKQARAKGVTRFLHYKTSPLYTMRDRKPIKLQDLIDRVHRQ